MMLAMGRGNGCSSTAGGEDELTHNCRLLGILSSYLGCQLMVQPYE